MTAPDEQENESAPLVRPYVITDGRGIPGNGQLDLITLITASDEQQRLEHLDPEKRSLLQLCSGGHLSVAEIAGHLDLPLNIIKVLLSDLLADGYLLQRAPVPTAQLVDTQVLQEVLDGLHARFG